MPHLIKRLTMTSILIGISMQQRNLPFMLATCYPRPLSRTIVSEQLSKVYGLISYLRIGTDSGIIRTSDYTMWLWWIDCAGAIQTTGFDIITDFPFFLAFLAIVQRFDSSNWGSSSAFQRGTTETIFNVHLKGPGGEPIEAVLDLTQVNLRLSFLGRASAVVAASSTSTNPLIPSIAGQTLAGVAMVAKVYRPEDTRVSEEDLLRLAYRVANTDPDVRGHVPIMVASKTWPDPSAESMAAILGEHILGKNNGRRATRCLRILLFLKLEPLYCLTGRYFMKAYLECFKC